MKSQGEKVYLNPMIGHLFIWGGSWEDMGISSAILGDNSEHPEDEDKWAGPSLSALVPL